MARRLLATRKGVVLVNAQILEELGNALRDKVHLYCVYLVICAALAHTARWTGKGAGLNGACIGTAVDLPHAKGATVEHRISSNGRGWGPGGGGLRDERTPTGLVLGGCGGAPLAEAVPSSLVDGGFYVIDTYEHALGLDICDGRRGSELNLRTRCCGTPFCR